MFDFIGLIHLAGVCSLIVRLSTAKTANAERRLVVCRLSFAVCRSVRDVCLFKLPDDTAELGTRSLFTATRRNGYGEVMYFPLEFETLLALQAVHVEVK